MNLQKPAKPIRDRKHIVFLSELPCCIPDCGYPSGPPHHLLRGSNKCAGRKAGDDFALPMCPEHHHALHMDGDETFFLYWLFMSDAPAMAQALYAASGDIEQAGAILRGLRQEAS